VINIGIPAIPGSVMVNQALALMLLFAFVCTAYPHLMQQFLQAFILSKRTGRMVLKRTPENFKKPDAPAE
jgi:hypothetical protein